MKFTRSDFIEHEVKGKPLKVMNKTLSIPDMRNYKISKKLLKVLFPTKPIKTEILSVRKEVALEPFIENADG